MGSSKRVNRGLFMKDILGYEGLYSITEDGRVWSYPKRSGYGKHKGKFLTQGLTTRGYPMVVLCNNKDRKPCRVHRLVASAFLPNHNNKSQINHIDGVKTNNNLSNLEWNTPKENMAHAYNVGLKRSLCKPIIQLSKSGEFISRFNSAREASIASGVDYKNISKCLTGHTKTSGGFIWRFA